MAARQSRPAKPARQSTALVRRYGRFYRRVPLPEGAKADDARATFKNGVLEVVVPAPERTIPRGRRIEVKAV
jgi:HSP20 family protein